MEVCSLQETFGGLAFHCWELSSYHHHPHKVVLNRGLDSNTPLVLIHWAYMGYSKS